jgi:DNA-3-methyladenine glycosylase II
MLPTLGEENAHTSLNQATESSVLPGDRDGGIEELPSLPPTFTPSIKKTLHKVAKDEVGALPPGIDVALLKGRLQGKKIK